MVEGLHQFVLRVGAGGDRLAVDAEDDRAVGVRVARLLPLHYVEDHIFGKAVVFGAVGLQLLDFALEVGGLGVVADHLDHRAAGCHAQFGVEIAYELHVGVVHAVEADGVSAVDNDYTFDHS